MKLCPFWHRWKYHNPYDRTCRDCGENQVSYCWSLKTWNWAWWETHREGNYK